MTGKNAHRFVDRRAYMCLTARTLAMTGKNAHRFVDRWPRQCQRHLHKWAECRTGKGRCATYVARLAIVVTGKESPARRGQVRPVRTCRQNVLNVWQGCRLVWGEALSVIPFFVNFLHSFFIKFFFCPYFRRGCFAGCNGYIKGSGGEVKFVAYNKALSFVSERAESKENKGF